MSIRFLIEIAIEPRSNADAEKLASALNKMRAEDPSLGVEVDQTSRDTILKGSSELHLDETVGILRRSYEVDFKIGSPQVAYREQLTRKVEIEYTHKHSGQFARVRIVFEPNEVDGGNVFESRIACDAMPEGFIRGVHEGIQRAAESGAIAGFPVVDLKATLIDGIFHDVDSSALAFEIASRAAAREALKNGASVLIEPIMEVEVVTPRDCLGSVIGDLNLRRGQIQSQYTRDDAAAIDAMVPLANMFGYANHLRAFSQGRATYAMQFSRYAPVPRPSDDRPFPPAAAMRA